MQFLRTLWRLLRRPRALLRQLRFLLDFLVFRTRYCYLASSYRSSAPPNGTALIVNLSDTPHRAITEGMLGMALGRAGATPVILTTRAYRWSQRYFRALGIHHFLFLEDFIATTDHRDDAARVRSFLGNSPSHADVLSYTVDGVNVGTNVLSTVLKRLRQGSINLSDPSVREMVTQMFLQSLGALRASEHLLDRARPQMLLFNEAGYTPYGELFGCALREKCNAVQYVHSQRLDAFVLKRYRTTENMVDPVSLSPANWARVRALSWTERQEETFMRELCTHYEDGTWFDLVRSEKRKHKAPDAVRRQLGLDPSKKTAVIFSHVAWDASFFFGKNLFADYDDWLVETVKAACGNPHLNWVIKLHPDYIWHTKGMQEHAEMRDMIAVLANVGSLPPHVSVVPPDTDISTYSFFAVTDYCITVRGTVGLECPCFGIPVFTAGTGRYSGLGFTEDSSTREEYLGKMRRLHEVPPLSADRRRLARRHAYGLFVLRPLPCRSFELEPIRKDGDVIDHQVVIHARSAADVESDPGLKVFADWTLWSQEEDYMAV